MDNPEKLATYGTQDEEKLIYVLNTTKSQRVKVIDFFYLKSKIWIVIKHNTK